MQKNVKRTERGWAGHFICADRCKFRRNTLLEFNQVKIVVSTVGLMQSGINGEGKGFSPIGTFDRYYETMAFHSDKTDKRYHDADVSQQVNFESEWAISAIDADDKANDMHEIVVNEIAERLTNGEYNESLQEYNRE